MLDKSEKFKVEVESVINDYNKYNFKLAKEKTDSLLSIYPNNSFLYNLLGSCFQKLGQLGKAKEVFLKSTQLDKNNFSAFNNLGNTLKRLGEFKLSENYFKIALKINPNHIDTIINYGSLYYELNDPHEAIKLYKKALAINDKIFQPHYNLALAYLSLGSLKEAEYHFFKTLKINPTFTAVDKLLSRFTNYTKGSKHLKQMNDKIENLSLSKEAEPNLYFALGKAYEDLKEHKKSFEYLEIGNKSQKQNINYNINSDLKIFDILKNKFQNYTFDKSSNYISKKKIIFIVGLPRSGTSLVEQIISSHTDVYGGGELKFLEELILKNFYKSNDFSQSAMDPPNKGLINKIRSEYFKKLDNFKTNKNIITDKAPLNFRWIGFIKILFPNAKVIHCKRNPKDNALSLYKNIFDEKLNWTYSQSDIFKFYSEYIDLMDLWNRKIESFIYNVQYENLISSPNKEIKNLINFCQLDWQESCIEFYKNKRPIKTVSIVQARNPLFKSSISSFENYKNFLNELFTNIEKISAKKNGPI